MHVVVLSTPHVRTVTVQQMGMSIRWATAPTDRARSDNNGHIFVHISYFLRPICILEFSIATKRKNERSQGASVIVK